MFTLVLLSATFLHFRDLILRSVAQESFAKQNGPLSSQDFFDLLMFTIKLSEDENSRSQLQFAIQTLNFGVRISVERDSWTAFLDELSRVGSLRIQAEKFVSKNPSEFQLAAQASCRLERISDRSSVLVNSLEELSSGLCRQVSL